jgi:hypothetical protein
MPHRAKTATQQEVDETSVSVNSKTIEAKQQLIVDQA